MLFLIVSVIMWLQTTIHLAISRRRSRIFRSESEKLLESYEFIGLKELTQRYKTAYLSQFYAELAPKMSDLRADIPFPLLVENLTRWGRLAVNRVMRRLRENVHFLAAASTTAPLLGVLGTTTMLVDVFRHVILEDESSLLTDLPGWLNLEISEAFSIITFGLLTGLIARWGYLGLQKRCAAIRAELNAEQLDLTNRMLRHHRRIRPLAGDEV